MTVHTDTKWSCDYHMIIVVTGQCQIAQYVQHFALNNNEIGAHFLPELHSVVGLQLSTAKTSGRLGHSA